MHSLLTKERTSADALGVPSSHVHFARGGAIPPGPVWLERVCLSSGREDIGLHGMDAAVDIIQWGPGVCRPTARRTTRRS